MLATYLDFFTMPPPLDTLVLVAEAMTLSRTNEELSIRLSGSEIKVQALTSQLEVSEKMVLELQVSYA